MESIVTTITLYLMILSTPILLAMGLLIRASKVKGEPMRGLWHKVKRESKATLEGLIGHFFAKILWQFWAFMTLLLISIRGTNKQSKKK